MKNVFLVFFLGLYSTAWAQQWAGSSNTSGQITRNGSVFINQENAGLMLDEGGNQRFGLMKYAGKSTGLYRTGYWFEISRVNSLTAPTSFTTDFYISSNGNVGVGSSGFVGINTSPLGKLEVYSSAGNVKFGDTAGDNVHHLSSSRDWVFNAVGKDEFTNLFTFRRTDYADINANTDLMVIHKNGNVGIGTSVSLNNYKLAVEGTLGAREIVATMAPWADFVFKPSYQLPSLTEVESYIQTNGHLPSVPSAQEIAKDGNNLAKTDAILLQKIEELTLYLIELKKDNEQLRQEVQNLKK